MSQREGDSDRFTDAFSSTVSLVWRANTPVSSLAHPRRRTAVSTLQGVQRSNTVRSSAISIRHRYRPSATLRSNTVRPTAINARQRTNSTTHRTSQNSNILHQTTQQSNTGRPITNTNLQRFNPMRQTQTVRQTLLDSIAEDEVLFVELRQRIVALRESLIQSSVTNLNEQFGEVQNQRVEIREILERRRTPTAVTRSSLPMERSAQTRTHCLPFSTARWRPSTSWKPMGVTYYCNIPSYVEDQKIGKKEVNCAVCLEDMLYTRLDLAATICGHVFCASCIHKAIQTSGKCPFCRKTQGLKVLRPAKFRSSWRTKL